ncbi:hypothetical protein E2C01_080229 [Portunus trituberculatus]|uniref:Uncharacterized protein n=1 Tax=Portunus trituberculatus TaxID=210409 RepID=A0A5B7IJ21_PORTR|nr:hypothetical protein [Portunus trituberculatus]
MKMRKETRRGSEGAKSVHKVVVVVVVVLRAWYYRRRHSHNRDEAPQPDTNESTRSNTRK